MAPPPVYPHPDPHSTLLPHLLPLLPSPLAIIRRIQFHFQSPYAHILSTFPPSTSLNRNLTRQFAVAYVDRSRAPETECWIYSSIELAPDQNGSGGDVDGGEKGAKAEDRILARLQLLALLAHISSLPTPPDFAGPSTTLLHVGAVHQRVLELLKGLPAHVTNADFSRRSDLKASSPDTAWTSEPPGSSVVKSHTIPWAKYLFAPVAAPGSVEPVAPTLPEGLSYGTVKREELAMVLDRLLIPRKERTLAILPSAAIRRAEQVGGGRGKTEREMVAWGFWGVDGSLTSLHVEETFRGRGLGKAIAGRLLQTLVEGEGGKGGGEEKRKWKGFTGVEQEQAWAHSDVAEYNEASIGVAKGLGGTYAWVVFWTWMDLERAMKEMVVAVEEEI